MPRRATPDNLSEVIGEILEEYGDDIKNATDEVTVQVARAGAQALNAASRAAFPGSKIYSRGWKAEIEETAVGTLATIWNAKVPGLPHLLEYGHATRNGGRVPGKPHISRVNDELEEEYDKKVRSAINDL